MYNPKGCCIMGRHKRGRWHNLVTLHEDKDTNVNLIHTKR